MKEWIDEKIKYLNPMVKQYALFEPTSEFYKKLEKIDIIPPFEEVINNINENKPPYAGCPKTPIVKIFNKFCFSNYTF